MLFFRSEDRVAEWCALRGVVPNPCVRMDQLWVLARTWYASRLTPESRRPSASEMPGIFASIGLTGPFWDPEARA